MIRVLFAFGLGVYLGCNFSPQIKAASQAVQVLGEIKQWQEQR